EGGRGGGVGGRSADLGLSDRHYLEYRAGEGRAAYERCQEEAAADHVFGVPFFMFADEPFWGYDRLGQLEQRLTEAGLEIGDKVTAALAAGRGPRRPGPRAPPPPPRTPLFYSKPPG